MGARLPSSWQKMKRPLSVIGIIAASVLVIALIVGIIGGYIFNWKGIGVGQKTLWGWLQLLIIPAVLAVGGYIINLTISRGEQEATKQRAQSEREAAEKHAEIEREIALDNQCEAALQEYIDKMAELLLHEKLRESKPEDKVRSIARARTLTLLARLNNVRKGSVLQFLHQSGLIEKDENIVDLADANLIGANLPHINLYGANLSRIYLTGANLESAGLVKTKLQVAWLDRTNLRYAALSEAYLGSAHLNNADLRGAQLFKAYMQFASLSLANLEGANLRNVDLSAASLDGANLRSADLTGAALIETELTGANLEGANLMDANLEGANLSKAIVTTEQLNKVKSLLGATMPDGSIHP